MKIKVKRSVVCGKVNELIYRGLFEVGVGDCAFVVVLRYVFVEPFEGIDLSCMEDRRFSCSEGSGPEDVVEGPDGDGVMVVVELEHLVGRGGEDVVPDVDVPGMERGVDGSQVGVDQETGLVVRDAVVPVVLFPLFGADDHGVPLDEDVFHGVTCEDVVVVVVEDDALPVVAPDGVALQDGVLASDQGDSGEFGMEKRRIFDGASGESSIKLYAMATE